jgi:signal transduction histidine kinase
MKHVRLYIFLYLTLAMALDVVYRSLDRVTRGHPGEWAEVLIEQATGFYSVLLLLPGTFWLARRWPFRLSPGRILMHLAAVVGFSVVHTSILWSSRSVLFPLLRLGPYDYGAMPVRYLMEFPSDVISYAMWVGAFTVYRNWLRTKELETQLVSARLESLTHQLQPHFLFNALNAVSATMYEDIGRADRMLERICDFLRATLRLPDSPMVPVSTELALARQYLEVMQARLEDRLHYEIHCDPQAESIPIPALLLQPLVENAVEHGQDPASGRLDIGIDVHRNGASIGITIRDRGPGVPSNHSNGHGISNATRRLKTVYGERATLRLSGHLQGGAEVEVRIPA